MVEEKDLLAANGATTPTAALTSIEENEGLGSNLTLVMPPKIEIDFMEWDEGTDEEGQPTLTPRLRRASISSFVPMKIFHRMLSGRVQVLKLKEGDAQNPEHSAEMMEWMLDMVLAVWQRSEPRMTKERFENGLQMDQVLELFNRFFGDLTMRLGERNRFLQTTRHPK